MISINCVSDDIYAKEVVVSRLAVNKKLNEYEVITFGNPILKNLEMEALRQGQRVGGYFLNCRNDVVHHHCYMCEKAILQKQ